MPNVVMTTLNTGKAKLDTIRNDVRIRADKAKRDIELGQGRIKDAGLDTIYAIGEEALMKAANLTEKLPLASQATERLKAEAGEMVAARERLGLPDIDGYDEMNVKDVVAALREIGPHECAKVRAYEARNKNRKTVLREIDRRLA